METILKPASAHSLTADTIEDPVPKPLNVRPTNKTTTVEKRKPVLTVCKGAVLVKNTDGVDFRVRGHPYHPNTVLRGSNSAGAMGTMSDIVRFPTKVAPRAAQPGGNKVYRGVS